MPSPETHDMPTLQIIHDVAMTTALGESLDRIAQVSGRMRKIVAVAEPWQDVVRERIFATRMQLAARLDGHDLTVDQIEALLAGEANDVAVEARVCVTNIARTAQWLAARSQDPSWVLSHETLLTLHFLLDSGRNTSTSSGRYRTTTLNNDHDDHNDYNGPRSNELPGAMGTFVGWVDERLNSMNPYVLAALAHLNLLALHPFVSATDEAARMLSIGLMERSPELKGVWLSFEQFFVEHDKELRDRARELLGAHWTPETVDPTSWVEWYVENIAQQTLRDEHAMQRARAEVAAVSVGLAQVGYGAPKSMTRSVLPVWLAIVGGSVSRRQLGRYLNVSEETLSRDLRRLSAEGLLVPEGKGRSARYRPGRIIASDDAFEQLVQIATIGGIAAVEQFLAMDHVGRSAGQRFSN